VRGAQSDGDATWSLEDDTDKPVVVKAIVNPDTDDAYKFLKWTGGGQDPKNPDDRRLVSAALVKDPTKPLPVQVKVNLN